MLPQEIESMLNIQTDEERKAVQEAWTKFQHMIGKPPDSRLNKSRALRKKKAKAAKESRRRNRKK
jgi:hypothetical protein